MLGPPLSVQEIAMNKPYQRDEVEQKQDFEGAKRELKQTEHDAKEDDSAQQPSRGTDEEE